MVIKKAGIDYPYDGKALTLGPEEIGVLHEDGWTIYGTIHEDYYEWVNDFVAIHDYYGYVFGNFEDEVFAKSEEAYRNFYENHKPNAWDYGDI